MRSLIIGGTGTLGRALARELLKEQGALVTCLSRCELKQKEMAAEFSDKRLLFVLGDIRDREAMFRMIRAYDAVFHVAALKHIDVLEVNPEECVKTNVLGTMNVADAAEANGIPYVVFSSTDKAVEPVNVYGMCKGISEKILLQRNLIRGGTKFVVYRWGNVLGSRGSAVPLFADAIREKRPVPLTSPEMTRFWIRIEDAASFVLQTFRTAPNDHVMIPPMKAAPVLGVVAALGELLKASPEIKSVPIRPGERLHELIRPGLNSKEAPQYSAGELKALLEGCI